MVDSAWVDNNSKATFTGKDKLPGGIYFMVSPTKTLLFELLMDDVQQMSIVGDSAKVEQVVIKGSKENDIFSAYTKYLGKQVPKLNALQAAYKAAKNTADSTNLRNQLIAENKALTDYRESIITKNPDCMLATFFQTVKRPDVPAIPIINGKPDSLYPYRYVREHFWDGVNFYDDRILRTPFFDPKLDEYFRYISPEPDSLIQEINYILLSARTGKEMFKYLLGKFTDKYINPEIMGQDKVFVFLFNNYFSKGDTTWLSAKQKEFIFNRAYSLMANQINEPAPQITLYDTLGKAQPLYNVTAPFTFIAFWDHTCGHCKEQIPRIDSIYKASWQALGVKIYSVNTYEKLHTDNDSKNAAIKEWSAYLQEKNISNWVQVFQPKTQRDEEQKNQQAGYRQLFDVYQTPTFYLLDKDKRIIAKKLSLEQFNDLILAKIKNEKVAK